MPLFLRTMMTRVQAPAKDDDLPGGDYGDDFEPTGADADDAADGNDSTGGASGDGGADEPTSELREVVEDPEEAPAAGAKGTGTPKTGKGKFIPVDRHEKLLKKERARREELEAQLQQSRAGQEVVKVNDNLEKIEDTLVSMEEKYNDLLAEGDTKGAAALMTQIRRKNAELNALAAQHRDAEVMARAVEKVRYDEALDRIEEAFPELDPDADEYDSETFQDVVDLMQAGRARGLSPTKALQRAVQRVMGVDTAAQKRAVTATPRVNEDNVASRRRGDAVKRNIDAARRTPPATHRVGAGNDAAGGALTAKAVMQMDEDEFAKLSDKDLARLRGDIL